MRLLIVHPGGIGDVLLALPVLRTLRRHHRDGEVGLLAGNPIGTLLRDCHEVDTVFPLESGALVQLLAGEGPRTSPFVAWLRACRSAQCWMDERDGKLRAALVAQGIRRVVVASPMEESRKSRHQTDRFLEAAECSCFEPEADRPLHVTKAMTALGRIALRNAGVPDHRPYVVIHPGSGSIHKCCHPSTLGPVFHWIRSKDFIPLIVGGPADEQQVGNLTALWPGMFCLMKETDLSTLAAVIRNAVLYIGHDSGITHLAAALAVPTVACFGPTDERRWGPRGRFVRVVTGIPCECATWDTVRECRDKSCLRISPAALVDACDNMLASSCGLLT
ncbi:MAG TPA: glycosyltransferase family 9 protein [Nitrospiraceae bacterium]|nr:glycosyltransferase family 9 protein [Nitrospiraceae bacterium]